MSIDRYPIPKYCSFATRNIHEDSHVLYVQSMCVESFNEAGLDNEPICHFIVPNNTDTRCSPL